ncbi:citrate synthase [Athelia psychrophila]|uniref:Citrate synthase n=1 Tax=Athelia psychrophila TaxID=1759441 RepID=A0A166NM32_9AGAM|nr:citrate synthase [Fibularhizoctonia sp. CBS 109695]
MKCKLERDVIDRIWDDWYKNEDRPWVREVIHHSVVHSDAEDFFRSFRYDAHPMAILTSAFVPRHLMRGREPLPARAERLHRWHHRLRASMDQQIFRPAGKATTLAAMTHCARHERDFVVPPTGLSYTGAFLYQMDHQGQENYKPHPALERALDAPFVLHADHELNAYPTTVLQRWGSLVDPHSARQPRLLSKGFKYRDSMKRAKLTHASGASECELPEV